MTARKTTTVAPKDDAPTIEPTTDAPTTDVRAVVLASDVPAIAARALGVNAKQYRDTLRDRFGVYVSRDRSAYDARARAFAYAFHTTNGDARKAVLQAWKDGADAPTA
jgi:hypothetical protein